MLLHFLNIRKVINWRKYPFFTHVFNNLPFFKLILANVVFGLFANNRFIILGFSQYFDSNQKAHVFRHIKIVILDNDINPISLKNFIRTFEVPKAFSWRLIDFFVGLYKDGIYFLFIIGYALKLSEKVFYNRKPSRICFRKP